MRSNARRPHAPRRAALACALALATLAGPATVLAATGGDPAPAKVDIPFETFTLPNGLRVVVHTDRKAPIVAVNIWYHVGSKDEPGGRSGFAHLFEHLMFQSSENNRGEYFTPFTRIGVTDQNGTTNTDRTNYFQNVPTTALDTALWMESDRMGHLLGAVDQAALDEQRGVVQNEKRQGENQPYGQAFNRLTAAMYPKGHPYHHSVIGSMNDLNAASLDDVRQWFRAWYGPNNAVLVLAGDIDVATAKREVAKYFGDIPAGPTMAQPKVDVAKRTQATRDTMEDQVPQPRVYKVWNVPQVDSPDFDRLQLLATVLGGSKSSRLDRRLVHRDKLVDSVSAMAYGKQLGSNFFVIANVKQGVDPAKVEAIIDAEIATLVAEGPTAEELERAKTGFRGGFVRGIERIGGFGGKADALAECAVYTGDPGCFRTSLATIEGTDAAALRKVGGDWLQAGAHTLTVMPGARTAATEEASPKPAPFVLPKPDAKFTTTAGIDRSGGVPVTTTFPELRFPAVERATLSNGTTVVLARRPEVPVVQMSYEFDAGYAADGDQPGIANFAMGMMEEGAGDLDALSFAERAEDLGASLGAGASLDRGSVYLSALKENLDDSVDLFADLVRAPRFDAAEIERVRASWIAGIAQEKARPQSAAMRVLPGLLFGAGHPYAQPATGTGNEASIAAIDRADLLEFHRARVRPEKAALVVVGDTTLAEVVPVLEKHFGDWRGQGRAPAAIDRAEVALPEAPRVFLIDQPGAVQANIIAAHVVPSSTDPGTVRFDIANGVLGGDFTARLNMNLREEKHWSYGASSRASGALGQRGWLAAAPVQIDRTADAMAEMRREIADYANGTEPPTDEEVARLKAINTLSLPGAYETAAAVASTISSNLLYGRPDDYVVRRKAEVEAMTPAQVAEAAKRLKPGALTWIVVGDLAQVEAPIRTLQLGEVKVIDADGKPAAPRPAAAPASKPAPAAAPAPAAPAPKPAQ